jgi:hypothetical protein
MTGTVPTPGVLRALLAEILWGAAGGDVADWSKAIGDVEKLPTWSNVRSNWALHPSGSAEQLVAIEKAAEVVRAAHPYVAI